MINHVCLGSLDSWRMWGVNSVGGWISNVKTLKLIRSTPVSQHLPIISENMAKIIGHVVYLIKFYPKNLCGRSKLVWEHKPQMTNIVSKGSYWWVYELLTIHTNECILFLYSFLCTCRDAGIPVRWKKLIYLKWLFGTWRICKNSKPFQVIV